MHELCSNILLTLKIYISELCWVWSAWALNLPHLQKSANFDCVYVKMTQ